MGRVREVYRALRGLPPSLERALPVIREHLTIEYGPLNLKRAPDNDAKHVELLIRQNVRLQTSEAWKRATDA